MSNNDTKINIDDDFEEEIETIDIDDENYKKYILDLSLSYETRIKLIHRYYKENQNYLKNFYIFYFFLVIHPHYLSI